MRHNKLGPMMMTAVILLGIPALAGCGEAIQQGAEQLAEGAARGAAEPAFAASLDRYTGWAVEAFGRPGTPGMAHSTASAP